MAFANFFLLFFLFLLESADSSCPNSFSCGNLGPLEFPLSNMQPDCGLFMVDCHSLIPRIQFQFGGEWFEILRRNSTNSLFVRSPNLQHQLGSSNCFSFTNLSLPNSPSSSFKISPNINLFLCSNESRNQVVDNYFQTYSLHTCPVFNVYYRNPINSSSSSSSSSSAIDIPYPDNCSMVQMPFNSSNQDYSSGAGDGDLFSMLTPEFTLEWNVSEDCNDCHRRGGQCTTSNMNGFLCRTERNRNRMTLMLVVTTAAFSLTALSVISIIFFIFFRGKHELLLKILRRPIETVKGKDIKNFLKNYENLAQKRYKYSSIKKMTNSFSDKLGKGGYGDVYKGKLPDDRLVAVKILNEAKGNGEEFINEVESISKTSHVNIVTLLGFCFEGSKRALIYEFMPNGSLELKSSYLLHHQQNYDWGGRNYLTLQLALHEVLITCIEDATLEFCTLT